MNPTIAKVLQIVGLVLLAMIAFQIVKMVLVGTLLLIKLAIVAGICIVAYLGLRKLIGSRR